MSIKPSGLWCDLCKKPIWDDPWWHIRVNGKEGHSCDSCKNLYEKDKEASAKHRKDKE